MRITFIPLLLAGFYCAQAHAAWHSPADIRARGEAWVLEQVRHLPGRTVVEIAPVDERLHLALCEQMQISPFGANTSYARQTLLVQCLAPSRWTLYLPVKVHLYAPVAVATHPLVSGHHLSGDDFVMQEKDVAELAAGSIQDSATVLGQEIQTNVSAGLVLRKDMLKVKDKVLQGQSVSIVAEGPGLHLNADAIALQNGKVGQLISAKNKRSGLIIRGVVQENGEIRVGF